MTLDLYVEVIYWIPPAQSPNPIGFGRGKDGPAPYARDLRRSVATASKTALVGGTRPMAMTSVILILSTPRKDATRPKSKAPISPPRHLQCAPEEYGQYAHDNPKYG